MQTNADMQAAIVRALSGRLVPSLRIRDSEREGSRDSVVSNFFVAN
jgi:hypothetical protein